MTTCDDHVWRCCARGFTRASSSWVCDRVWRPRAALVRARLHARRRSSVVGRRFEVRVRHDARPRADGGADGVAGADAHVGADVGVRRRARRGRRRGLRRGRPLRGRARVWRDGDGRHGVVGARRRVMWSREERPRTHFVIRIVEYGTQVMVRLIRGVLLKRKLSRIYAFETHVLALSRGGGGGGASSVFGRDSPEHFWSFQVSEPLMNVDFSACDSNFDTVRRHTGGGGAAAAAATKGDAPAAAAARAVGDRSSSRLLAARRRTVGDVRSRSLLSRLLS